MNNKTKGLLLALVAAPAFVAAQPVAGDERLGGFFYGSMAAPTGWEWQSPDSVAYNKQQPHAWFFSFQNAESARKLLPEHSTYHQSLNGRWKFHWVKNPAERPQDFFRTDFDASAWDDVQVPMNWNVAGIQKDGGLKYGQPLYSNQRVIFQHRVKPGDWKGGVMRQAPKDWLSAEYPNEVGSYRRTFSVPAQWKEREVYLNFDGVDSFFYLYVNGKYVGFSKNSRNLAQFNITPYLNRGRELSGRGGVPPQRRLLPREPGHVPPAGHLPQRVAHGQTQSAGARPRGHTPLQPQRRHRPPRRDGLRGQPLGQKAEGLLGGLLPL